MPTKGQNAVLSKKLLPPFHLQTSPFSLAAINAKVSSLKLPLPKAVDTSTIDVVHEMPLTHLDHGYFEEYVPLGLAVAHTVWPVKLHLGGPGTPWLVQHIPGFMRLKRSARRGWEITSDVEFFAVHCPNTGGSPFTVVVCMTNCFKYVKPLKADPRVVLQPFTPPVYDSAYFDILREAFSGVFSFQNFPASLQSAKNQAAYLEQVMLTLQNARRPGDSMVIWVDQGQRLSRHDPGDWQTASLVGQAEFVWA